MEEGAEGGEAGAADGDGGFGGGPDGGVDVVPLEDFGVSIALLG